MFEKLRRDSIEIYMGIIAYAKQQCGIVKLSYALELNPSTTHQYISNLEKRNLINVGMNGKRKVITTTPKGLSALGVWDQFLQSIV